MGAVTNQIVIMFIILAIGFICGKARLIDSAGNKTLSNLSLLLVNPLLIFVSYQTEFSPSIAKNLAFTLLASVVAYAVQTAAAFLLIRKNRSEQPIERLSLLFSNNGYIGIPLVQSVFGSQGVIYLTVFITVFNLLVWTLGVSQMTGKTSLKESAKSLCTPALFAIILGLAMFFLKIRLPSVIYEPLSTIGSMNTPLAMIIAGATLAGTDILKCLRKPVLYVLAALKLVAIPALCIFALLPLRLIGLGDMQLEIVIIAVACPSAAITTMFAHRYGRNSVYASEIFALSTIFSAGTIPLVLWFLSLLGISA